MATAESTKPVAEPKIVAPVQQTSTVTAEQPAPVTSSVVNNETEYQRDTFDQKVLDDLNGGSMQQVAESAAAGGVSGLDLDQMGGMNLQKISDLPKNQKKMIREKRFGSDMYSGLDTN